IIVDSSETEIIAVLKRLLDIHNTKDGGTNRVVLTASWYSADIDNNCDLIKA
ncbi:glutamate receptor subunit protein GluR2 precursor, partial [Biomphalaria glabrata]